MKHLFIKPLKEVTYEQFKEFLNSLDEERKTWSLDLQALKNDKEFYDTFTNLKHSTQPIVCLDGEKVIGLCSFRYFDHLKLPQVIEVSFVVKKEYQSKSIGSTMLREVEVMLSKTPHTHIVAKHYKDNIASHKAFLKAGYGVCEDCNEHITSEKDNDVDWKIKEIG
tara:strand:+ start:66 stop:563 length:498 start_codon:yes stop_codon:yes gene_type:complete